MKQAYCSGCGDYVTLDEHEVCPGAHPRSCYRDVREVEVQPSGPPHVSAGTGVVPSAKPYRPSGFFWSGVGVGVGVTALLSGVACVVGAFGSLAASDPGAMSGVAGFGIGGLMIALGGVLSAGGRRRLQATLQRYHEQVAPGTPTAAWLLVATGIALVLVLFVGSWVRDYLVYEQYQQTRQPSGCGISLAV